MHISGLVTKINKALADAPELRNDAPCSRV